ncbi:MAG: hypothetical protein HKN23_12700, partial [Verrucomicrobiales bacterium]|nr:hypothetical protein [Verrucomicrobiales bacterium]
MTKETKQQGLLVEPTGFIRKLKPIRQGWFAILTLFTHSPADAQDQAKHKIEHKGATFWVYRLDLKEETLRLFLSEEKGKPLTFKKLEEQLNRQGKSLKFAMNSGIYEPGFLPTGLHIADGKTVVKLNLKDHVKKRPDDLTPNVYLKPNGVFFIRADGKSAGVLESHEFSRSGETPILATQSG